MDFRSYQAATRRTAGGEKGTKLNRAILALGLAGESGEVVDYIKKGIGHDHGIDPVTLTAELGDVLWYVARLADEWGIDLNDVAVWNITKLETRYPEGFSSEASQARLDELIA